MPTVLDVATIRWQPADEFDGISLLELLLHEKPLPERTIFWRTDDEKAARRGPRKLVHREDSTILFNLEWYLREHVDISDQYPDKAKELTSQLAQRETDIRRGWP